MPAGLLHVHVQVLKSPGKLGSFRHALQSREGQSLSQHRLNQSMIMLDDVANRHLEYQYHSPAGLLHFQNCLPRLQQLYQVHVCRHLKGTLSSRYRELPLPGFQQLSKHVCQRDNIHCHRHPSDQNVK